MYGLDRTIHHWTGGGPHASSIDKKHYFLITEFDGNVVQGDGEPEDNIVTSDGDYMAHTRNLNTGSIPLAMAGMLGAKESPLDFGDFPITRVQFEAHCRSAAKVHMDYAIPVTRKTCLWHSEVEGTLGVKQRGKWDVNVLEFEPNIRGAQAVGDYMRERVMSYMAPGYPKQDDFPVLRMGARGGMVKELQELLADARVFSGKKDGKFGPLTHRSVVAYQSGRGLQPDGIVGAITWSALMRDEEPEDRDIDIVDLRESGSQTIKSADDLTKVAGSGGIMAAGGLGLEMLSGVSDQLSGAQGHLETVSAITQEYWHLIALALVAFFVWRYANRIRSTRVNDARTGRNLGR